MDDATGTPSRQMSLRVATLLLVTGMVIGFVVRGDRSIVGDVRLLEAIQSVQVTGLEPVVNVVDFIGSTGGGIIAAVVLIAIGLATHHRRYVFQVLSVIALRLIGEVLKPTIESPRPPLDYLRDPDRALTTFGYPSGHAFTYSCIGGMIIVLAITLRVSDLWRRTSITLACLLVLAGAFARPWLGLHWPYDMVGGTLFGSAAVMITLAILPVRTSPSHGQPQAPG